MESCNDILLVQFYYKSASKCQITQTMTIQDYGIRN